MLRVTKKRTPLNSIYKLKGQELAELSTSKYFGVDLSSNLDWKEHIDQTVKKAVQGQEDTDIIQNDLNILQEWEKAWDMEFNPSKCQVVHISRSRKPIKNKYTMHEQVLDSIDHAR